MSKQRCTYIGSSHSFLLLGRPSPYKTPPSMLRIATAPSRGGLGITVQSAHKGELAKLHVTPEAPLLGGLPSECEAEGLKAISTLQNYTQLIFYQQIHLDARVFVIFSGGSRAKGRYRPNWRNCRQERCTVSGAGSASTGGSRSFRRSR